MILNGAVAILRDIQTGLWHPIFFTDHPLPGPPLPGKPERLKSKGHHTTGFDQRADAVIEANKVFRNQKVGFFSRIDTEHDYLWDSLAMPVPACSALAIDSKTFGIIEFFKEEATSNAEEEDISGEMAGVAEGTHQRNEADHPREEDEEAQTGSADGS